MNLSTIHLVAPWTKRAWNNIIVVWAIMSFCSYVHATIELSPQNENLSFSLKSEKEIWLESYKIERENYRIIMDIIAKNKKNIQPLPNATPGWPKFIPWQGYIVMLQSGGNTYLFLLKNSPKELDFYYLKSHAIMTGRWSVELDSYLERKNHEKNLPFSRRSL